LKRLYEDERKIQELSNIVNNSMSFENIVYVLSNILGVEATTNKITEDTVTELFSAVKEMAENYQDLIEKFRQYQQITNALIKGLGQKLPTNVKTLIDKLSHFAI